MNRQIIEAQQIIRTAITYAASPKGRKVLASAAFYLGDQVWGNGEAR